METTKKRSDCPVSCSLDVWGDKWSLLIIRDLSFQKECTYGDFLKSPEKISTNILANRLQLLEENKIILRRSHPDSKVKILYALTQKGIDLLPTLVEINLWAAKYFPIPEDRREMIEAMKQNKAEFIRSNTERLGGSQENGVF